jgi:hypothetical protein
MAVYIIGHGGLDSDRPETFVPTGTTISFFSDEDEDLRGVNALAAMASGTGATESFGAGERIPNYSLDALMDRERQQQMTVDPGRIAAKYVGDQLEDGIYLCEDTGGQCTGGVHNCAGVFGVVKDPVILYLACRGVEDEDGGFTKGLGPTGNRDTLAVDAIDEWFEWFKNTVDSDPDQVASRWDGLPQGTQAMLLNKIPIRKWSYVREARNFLRDNGPDTFRAWVNSSPQSDEKDLYLEDPEIKKALEDADEAANLQAAASMFNQGEGEEDG